MFEAGIERHYDRTSKLSNRLKITVQCNQHKVIYRFEVEQGIDSGLVSLVVQAILKTSVFSPPFCDQNRNACNEKFNSKTFSSVTSVLNTNETFSLQLLAKHKILISKGLT